MASYSKADLVKLNQNTNNCFYDKYSYPEELQKSFTDDKIIELIDLLQDIDSLNSMAKLNEISMTDNNGKRIYF